MCASPGAKYVFVDGGRKGGQVGILCGPLQLQGHLEKEADVASGRGRVGERERERESEQPASGGCRDPQAPLTLYMQPRGTDKPQQGSSQYRA